MNNRVEAYRSNRELYIDAYPSGQMKFYADALIKVRTIHTVQQQAYRG